MRSKLFQFRSICYPSAASSLEGLFIFVLKLILDSEIVHFPLQNTLHSTSTWSFSLFVFLRQSVMPPDARLMRAKNYINVCFVRTVCNWIQTIVYNYSSRPTTRKRLIRNKHRKERCRQVTLLSSASLVAHIIKSSSQKTDKKCVAQQIK